MVVRNKYDKLFSSFTFRRPTLDPPHKIISELFEVYGKNLSQKVRKHDVKIGSLFGGRYTEPIIVCLVGELFFFYENRFNIMFIRD